MNLHARLESTQNNTYSVMIRRTSGSCRSPPDTRRFKRWTRRSSPWRRGWPASCPPAPRQSAPPTTRFPRGRVSVSRLLVARRGGSGVVSGSIRLGVRQRYRRAGSRRSDKPDWARVVELWPPRALLTYLGRNESVEPIYHTNHITCTLMGRPTWTRPMVEAHRPWAWSMAWPMGMPMGVLSQCPWACPHTFNPIPG